MPSKFQVVPSSQSKLSISSNLPQTPINPPSRISNPITTTSPQTPRRRHSYTLGQEDPLFTSSIQSTSLRTSDHFYSLPEDIDSIHDDNESLPDIDIEAEVQARLNFIRSRPFSRTKPSSSSSTNPSLVYLTPRTMRSVLTGKSSYTSTSIKPEELNYDNLDLFSLESVVKKKEEIPKLPFSRSVSQTVGKMLSNQKRLFSAPLLRRDCSKSTVLLTDDMIDEQSTVVKISEPHGRKSKSTLYSDDNSTVSQSTVQKIDGIISNTTLPSLSLFAGPSRHQSSKVNDFDLPTETFKESYMNSDTLQLFENMTRKLLKEVEKTVNITVGEKFGQNFDSRSTPKLSDQPKFPPEFLLQVELLQELQELLLTFDRDSVFKKEIKNSSESELKLKILQLSRDLEQSKSRISDFREMNSLLEYRFNSMERAMMEILHHLLAERQTSAELRRQLEEAQRRPPTPEEFLEILDEPSEEIPEEVKEDVCVAESKNLIEKSTNTYSKAKLPKVFSVEVETQNIVESRGCSPVVFLTPEPVTLPLWTDPETSLETDLPLSSRLHRDSSRETFSPRSTDFPEVEVFKVPRSDSGFSKPRTSASRSEPTPALGYTSEVAPLMTPSPPESLAPLVTHSRGIQTAVSEPTPTLTVPTPRTTRNTPTVTPRATPSPNVCTSCEELKLRLAILEEASHAYTLQVSVLKQRLARTMAGSLAIKDANDLRFMKLSSCFVAPSTVDSVDVHTQSEDVLQAEQSTVVPQISSNQKVKIQRIFGSRSRDQNSPDSTNPIEHLVDVVDCFVQTDGALLESSTDYSDNCSCVTGSKVTDVDTPITKTKTVSKSKSNATRTSTSSVTSSKPLKETSRAVDVGIKKLKNKPTQEIHGSNIMDKPRSPSSKSSSRSRRTSLSCAEQALMTHDDVADDLMDYSSEDYDSPLLSIEKLGFVSLCGTDSKEVGLQYTPRTLCTSKLGYFSTSEPAFDSKKAASIQTISSSNINKSVATDVSFYLQSKLSLVHLYSLSVPVIIPSAHERRLSVAVPPPMNSPMQSRSNTPCEIPLMFSKLTDLSTNGRQSRLLFDEECHRDVTKTVPYRIDLTRPAAAPSVSPAPGFYINSLCPASPLLEHKTTVYKFSKISSDVLR
ncbi:hypothetical protein RCL1_000118 [Eukaryota sp. TZLM3-RCL]